MPSNPRLPWTLESAYLAFHLFGRETLSPCPGCFALWTTRVTKTGVVTPAIKHARNCQCKEAIKSLR